MSEEYRKRTKKLGGRPSNRPDAKTLLYQYEHYTSTELSRLYDVRPQTIQKWAYLSRKELQQQQQQAGDCYGR